MKAFWNGTLLVRESANAANNIPIQISSTLVDQDQYFHAQISLAAGEQAHTVSIPFSQIAVLYVKARIASDDTPAQVIIGLDGYAQSVATGEVKASEVCIFRTDVVAVSISNDNAVAVIVEVAAVGE